MTDQDRVMTNVAIMNEAIAAVIPRSRPRYRLDERTGRYIAGRDLADEIPTRALASYERWKAAVAAGEPQALATYAKLLPGRPSELALTFLADRIDAADPAAERAIVDAIFDRRYGDLVHPVMRDAFMRRSDEAAFAVKRLKQRLHAACATPTDGARVRACANVTVSDEMLVAFCADFAGKYILGFRIDQVRPVTCDDDMECMYTQAPIPASEHFVGVDTTGDDGIERSGCISKSAVWVYYVLGNLDLGFPLGADEVARIS